MLRTLPVRRVFQHWCYGSVTILPLAGWLSGPDPDHGDTRQAYVYARSEYGSIVPVRLADLS
jgi:hypothetical protein